eukprot:scaffold47953_cov73-Phaeocystis_antarctica.AAC.2
MGITLFVMLSGEAPFQQSGSVERLLSTVCTASIDTSGKTWQAVSAEAKAFVTALLKRDPRARMGLEGIRASPWLSATMGQLEREIEREIAREIAPSPPPPDTEEEDLALAMALSSSLAEAQEAQEGSSDMIKEPAVAPAPAAAMEAAMDLLGLFDAPTVSQPPPAVPPAASVSAAGAGAGAGSHGEGLLDLFAAPATPMVLGVLGVLGAAPAVPAAAEGEWCIDAATVETFSAMFASACAAQGPGVDRLGKAEAGAVLSLSGLPTELQICSLADHAYTACALHAHYTHAAGAAADLEPGRRRRPRPARPARLPALLLARAAQRAGAAAAARRAAAAAARVCHRRGANCGAAGTAAATVG